MFWRKKKIIESTEYKSVESEHDGVLVYKCRKCNQTYNVETYYEKEKFEEIIKYGRTLFGISKFHIHTCANGDMGVGELIGFESTGMINKRETIREFQ